MLKKLLIFILIAAVIAGAFFYFYEKKIEDPNLITLYGNVDVRQVDVGFQVAGRVVEIFFEEGDLVQPGDLLGILDKRIYVEQVKEAEAHHEMTKRNLANSEKIFHRRQELINDGSVSHEDLEDTENAYNVQKANFKQTLAALDLALTNLEYTKVHAPTAGTILTRIREPGTVVNVGDAIYTVSITSPVWIRAFVSEKNLGNVVPGMEAEIFTDTPDGKTYTGKVGFISPVAEFTPKTVETTDLRTDLVYRIRVYADTPDNGLRQGMPVTVKLRIKPKENQ